MAVLHAIPKNWVRWCLRQRHNRWTHWTKPEETTLKGMATTSHKVTRVCRYGLSWTTSEQRLIRTNFKAQGVSPRVTTARHTCTNNLQDRKRARYGRLYAKIYIPELKLCVTVSIGKIMHSLPFFQFRTSYGQLTPDQFLNPITDRTKQRWESLPQLGRTIGTTNKIPHSWL